MDKSFSYSVCMRKRHSIISGQEECNGKVEYGEG